MYIKICIFCFFCVFRLATCEDDCGSHHISCTCGREQAKMYMELERHTVKDSVTGIVKCAGPDPYQACRNVSCSLDTNISSLRPKKIGWSFLYPRKITFPRGGLPEDHRLRREAEPCQVPPLQNAAVECWVWPGWMNCDIVCVHGYALRSEKEVVTTKNINCRKSENVWKPHSFQDCEPYLNCKVQLVKPGNLKCVEPGNGPPYCEISCLDYDDLEATDLQKYECIDDTYGRTLPHCVTLQETDLLIPKPK